MKNSEFYPDSPISYIIEEGEISSGNTSPADTVKSTCTQTIDTGVKSGSPSPTLEPANPPKTFDCTHRQSGR